MRRRRLWFVAVISGFSVLLLTTAKPASESVAAMLRWEHVNKTCRTRDCNDSINYEQLHAIQSYMNLAADPCDDFHSYACGNWRNQNPNGTTMMRKANDELTLHFVELFETWLREHTPLAEAGIEELNQRRMLAELDLLPERKAKRRKAEIREVATARIERDQDEETGQTTSVTGVTEKPVTTTPAAWNYHDDPVLQKMLQYYSVCSTNELPSLGAYFELTKSHIKWQLSDYNWLETLALLGRYGYQAHFLTMNVQQANVSQHRIMIRPHEPEAPLNLTAEIMDTLRAFTNQSQIALQQHFQKIEADLLQLNCQFCQYAPVNDDFDDYDVEECDCYVNHPLTFAELHTQLPEIDWQRYLSLQLRRHVESHEFIGITNLELLRSQLVYVQQLDPELNLLYTLASFLNYMDNQRQSLHKHGLHSASCIHHMRKLFHMPMSYIYEHAVYSTQRKQSEELVQQIFKELKREFALIIAHNRMQFSSTIVQKLQQKLAAVAINVGNLPQNVTAEFYYDYIAAYSFTNDFHYNHLHSLEVFHTQMNALLDLPEQTLRQRWHSFNMHTPSLPDNLDASPYYFCRSNLILIPYAYLRPPFYDVNFWPALLYGDLANTLGHELVHAFDIEFLKFDPVGNWNTQLLSSMYQNHKFCTNLACVERGTNFVHERIADVSGTRLALNAFLSLDPNALQRNGELYFLEFAQFFCGSTDPVTFHNEDPTHDVDSLRLNYVLGLMPEFARVFNCPAGSGMNPIDKCEMYA